jgi:hypothetical protein
MNREGETIAVIAGIARDRQTKTLPRMNADQDVIGKPGKNAVQDTECTD